MIFFTFLDFFSREKNNTILFHQFMIVWSDTKTNEDLKMFQPEPQDPETKFYELMDLDP